MFNGLLILILKLRESEIYYSPFSAVVLRASSGVKFGKTFAINSIRLFFIFTTF